MSGEIGGTMTGQEKRRGGRPRSGTLEFRRGRWFGRLTITVDGENIRRWFDLGTDSKPVARRKLARLAKEHAGGAPLPSPEEVKAPETVDSFAEAWLGSRQRRGVAVAAHERAIYEHVWKPAIGALALGNVRSAAIREVVEACADGSILPKQRRHQRTAPKRYSRQSVSHIRAVAFRLFDAAWRDELVAENPVARVSVPDMETQTKVRAVLTDAELAALVSHPDVDAEIKLLVLLSRTIGGVRAGDLNTLDWTAFSPRFETCTFVRRKTRKKRPAPVTFEVPAAVRPFLDAWWRRHGSPEAGPVFPVRRGKRAGEAKKRSNMSYADRLRRELIRAGVTRRELHEETATTLPVDFHSTRRAYGQSLARAGLNEQAAMDLTGHSDSKVHRRYLENVSVRVLPSPAVPALDPSVAVFVANRPRSGTKPKRPDQQSSNFSGAGHEARTRDPELGNATRAGASRSFGAEPSHPPPSLQPHATGRNRSEGQSAEDDWSPAEWALAFNARTELGTFELN